MNDSTFYLESSFYQHHEKDLEAFEAAGGRKNIKDQEQMYLVVRSLKHNNEKIVSLIDY